MAKLIQDDLENSYVIDSTSNCWIWKHFINKEGYGQFNGMRRSKRTTIMAHIGVYEHYKEAVKEGFQLDHKCRNHSCVNPDHLEPVTIAINSQRGNNAKLTPEQVEEIRAAFKKGSNLLALAIRFKVSKANICLIVNNKAWI